MPSEVIPVPVALLMDPNLPAASKLAWMVARLRLLATDVGTARPAVTTAISRPTMLQGMAQLRMAGWDPSHPCMPGATVPVPTALITNRKLGIHTRVLYGQLLFTEGFRHPNGHFSNTELARLVRANPQTVTKALKELVAAEWLKIDQASRRAPVHFELTFPGFDRENTELAMVQTRLERAQYHGEQIMREYLSLLVDATDFEDDAAPGFLVNPRTGERLQFDRFYREPDVAWEYNGPQHERPTEFFPADVVARQQERDLIKLGLCAKLGIKLVVVESKDLTVAGMRAKIGDLLPTRALTGHEQVAAYLEAESVRHRRRVAKL